MKFVAREKLMNASLLFPLLIFAWMNSALLHTLQAQQSNTNRISIQTGSVNGKIEILKMNMIELSQQSTRHHTYGKMNATPMTPPATNEYENVVVYLEGQSLKRETQPASSHSQIDQRNAEFFPHVLPVLRGTVVDFINRDNVYHNVFSLSPAKKFNIGRRPTGQAVPVVMDKTGIVQVFCDIHSNMAAYILVLDNDYFTQPNRHGHYSIDRIPPGTYTLKVWHERLASQEQTITISPNSTTSINFVME